RGECDDPDEEPDERARGELAPAAAEHRCERGAGQRVCAEANRPRPLEWIGLDLVELRGCGDRIHAAFEDVMHDVVEPCDRVEIDGPGPDAEREAALAGERP